MPARSRASSSSAGVGQTYAMLIAGRKRLEEGVDVVAGVIETHGRAETAAQVGTLPLLPPAQVAYRDRTLAEFDLDGALQRNPRLLLVDELAHSNVAGSRHPKRWQDVEELLARLRAGKVYRPEQAERAGRNFFRKGNLMALRELALRRTADRVEDDVQAYRVDQSIDRVWKTEAALLCCIGPRDAAEHLVRSAARMAQQMAVAWHAVYVETPSLQRLPDAQRERILRTVKLAEELGATTAVIAAQDVAAGLVAHARQYNLSKLLVGHNRPRPWWRRHTFSERLARLAPDVDLIEVGEGQAADATTPRARADVGGLDAPERASTGGRRRPR
ncbi:MAG: two-component system sensor histidine kinase KdbD, partial [Variovorax sp.]